MRVSVIRFGFEVCDVPIFETLECNQGLKAEGEMGKRNLCIFL